MSLVFFGNNDVVPVIGKMPIVLIGNFLKVYQQGVRYFPAPELLNQRIQQVDLFEKIGFRGLGFLPFAGCQPLPDNARSTCAGPLLAIFPSRLLDSDLHAESLQYNSIDLFIVDCQGCVPNILGPSIRIGDAEGLCTYTGFAGFLDDVLDFGFIDFERLAQTQSGIGSLYRGAGEMRNIIARGEYFSLVRNKNKNTALGQGT